MSKNIGENISKNLSSKYSPSMLGAQTQSATDAHKTASKREILKTAEVTGDLIGNKIPEVIAEFYDDKKTKFSRRSPQNSSETVESETKIPKKYTYTYMRKAANCL